MRHKINRLGLYTYHRMSEMLEREFRNSEMRPEDARRIAATLERVLRNELEEHFAKPTLTVEVH